MNRNIKSFLAVLLMALAQTRTVSAASVGVNFVNTGDGGVQNGQTDSLAADESAGAPGYAQINWNNFGRWGATVPANDSSGAASGVTVTWDSNNTWQNGSDLGNPDGKLMYGYLDATGSGTGNNINTEPYQFWWNENKPEAYVTGISAWLATQSAAKYDVVVYLDGDATGGRVCETWLQAGSVGDPPTDLGEDLSGHVFVRDSANFSGTYVQVPLSANSVGNAADGNYVVFLDQTADSFLLRTEERGFHAAFIAGFQIVPRSSSTPPAISPQPRSSSVYSGRTVTFKSGASGSEPLVYQWRKNGVDLGNGGNIAGATTNILTLSNVTDTDLGDYTLVVTNAGGAVTSSVAALTLASAPVAGSFAHALVTNGVLAHWRLNETGSPANGDLLAFDYAGGNVGLYTSNSLPGQAGAQSPTFPGFEATNNAVQTTPDFFNPTWVTVPSPALNTNTVTLAAWIYPVGAQADGTGIFMSRGATTAGLIFNTADNQIGYTWNNDSAATWSWNSGIRPPDSQWSLVVLVIEPTKATLYLGSGGTLTNAANTVAHANEVWGGAARIGSDPASINQTFTGLIDEVAMFNRALSFDEVAALYERATGIPQSAPPAIISQPVSRTRYAGKTLSFVAAASGTAPLHYQWQKGGATVPGATTDTLTLTNITAANAGDYTVVVTNSFNSVTSEVATLTVVAPTTAYESTIIAANPVAYWRLDEFGDPSSGTEAASDYWGGFNGTYGVAVQNAFSGISGPAVGDGFGVFGDTNNAIQCANNLPTAYVTTPALNFSGNAVTITSWVYPIAPQMNWSAMIFSRGGTPATGLNISGAGNLGYHWNDQFWNVESGLVLPVDQWSFVALVVQPDRGTLYLYNTNGLQSYTNIAAHVSHSFGAGIRIGGDPQSDDRIFNGRVDEVSVFNYALSPQQIAGLVGSVSLKLEKSGANLILSWPSGTLLEAESVTGPWMTNTAASPYVVSPTADKKFYRVQVR